MKKYEIDMGTSMEKNMKKLSTITLVTETRQASEVYEIIALLQTVDLQLFKKGAIHYLTY